MIQPKIQTVYLPTSDNTALMVGTIDKYDYYKSFQKERMYSEEDLKSAFFNGGDMKDIEEFNYWFEQFKREFVKEPINVLEDGDVSVDLEKFVVTYKGVEMRLPKKVTQVLHYLMSNKNKVVRRDDILYDVWGKNVVVGDRTIDVHIRKIKIALYDDCISSVKGVGYKWN